MTVKTEYKIIEKMRGGSPQIEAMRLDFGLPQLDVTNPLQSRSGMQEMAF